MIFLGRKTERRLGEVDVLWPLTGRRLGEAYSSPWFGS